MEEWKNQIGKFLEKRIKITLSNGTIYTGFVLSVGDEYVKIRDLRENIVFVVVNMICSIEEVSQ